MIGATMWHGPHQVAQKSTMASPVCCSTSTWNVASVMAAGCFTSSITLHAPSRDVSLTSMNPSVAHVGIAVTSVTEALSFYRDVLGLSPGRPEIADGATIVRLT